MTAPLDLDAVEARANAATPGPWREAGLGDGRLLAIIWDGTLETPPEHDWLPVAYFSDDDGEASDVIENRAFICAARTDVPALVRELREALAELERLTAENATYRAADYSALTGSVVFSGADLDAEIERLNGEVLRLEGENATVIRQRDILLEAEQLATTRLSSELREERNRHDGEAQQWRRDGEELSRLRGLLADWWESRVTTRLELGGPPLVAHDVVEAEARRCAEERRAGK